MSAESKRQWLPTIIRRAVVIITVSGLILLLTSFLILREEIDKKVEGFVSKTIQNAERALHSNDAATKTVLGIVIAQEFTDTFKKVRVQTVAYELVIHSSPISIIPYFEGLGVVFP